MGLQRALATLAYTQGLCKQPNIDSSPARVIFYRQRYGRNITIITNALQNIE